MKLRFACLFLLAGAAACAGAAETIHVLTNGPQARHYLAWRGRPILLIGDSVTQGWMESGTNFDQAAYVDALAARGINLLMLWSFKGTRASRQAQDRRLGYDAPEIWPWIGSPEDRSFDLRRFNPAYFDRLRTFVGRAEQKGIVVLITVHDGWTKTCFDGHPFNRALGNGPLAAREQYVALADTRPEMPPEFDPAWTWPQQNQHFQERFCAKLIETLAPFSNVLFEMFNEGEWYPKQARRRHEEHFLAFFRARCTNPLLSNADHIAGLRAHREPNADVVTLHPQGWVGQFPTFARGFDTEPAKPYLYSEPVPEFDGQRPSLDEIRRSVWETALAGAGWVNQNDASFGWDARAAIAAQARARDQAYDVAGHCARFFNGSGVRFWEMKPEGRLASTGVCLARPGEEYVVYATKGGRFTVDLTVAGQKALSARWYNPRTGEFHAGADVRGGNGQQAFEAPFSGDAALHLAERWIEHRVLQSSLESQACFGRRP